MSSFQIAVDLFALNSQYVDMATLTGISKFSGGCIHHFPGFHVARNPPSVGPFTACLTRYVTRKIGFEAVMRIRWVSFFIIFFNQLGDGGSVWVCWKV